MAKKRTDLTEIPESGQLSFEDRYPDLKEWLDGGVWELESGVDFTTKTETMYQALKGYAKRRQLDVGLRTSKGNILIQNRST